MFAQNKCIYLSIVLCNSLQFFCKIFSTYCKYKNDLPNYKNIRVTYFFLFLYATVTKWTDLCMERAAQNVVLKKNSLLSVHILKHFKFREETPVPVKQNT